jgi:hypothetical protein
VLSGLINELYREHIHDPDAMPISLHTWALPIADEVAHVSVLARLAQDPKRAPLERSAMEFAALWHSIRASWRKGESADGDLFDAAIARTEALIEVVLRDTAFAKRTVIDEALKDARADRDRAVDRAAQERFSAADVRRRHGAVKEGAAKGLGTVQSRAEVKRERICDRAAFLTEAGFDPRAEETALWEKIRMIWPAEWGKAPSKSTILRALG